MPRVSRKGENMIDLPSQRMAFRRSIAIDRIQGVNDNMTKPHYHEYFEIYYLESGERYHIVNDTLYHLKSGSFVLFPPFVMHYSYGEKDVPFKRLDLYFSKDSVMFPELLLELEKGGRVFEASEDRDILTYLRNILKEQDEEKPYYENQMILLLNQMLIHIVRGSVKLVDPTSQDRIAAIIRYLNENYTESITLNQLASRFYINPSYLCREFKKHIGSTVVQYINSMRILHAQRLLQETDQSVTEISKIVGFSNVTHFNRIYKSLTGTSPTKTRKKIEAERKAALAKHSQS